MSAPIGRVLIYGGKGSLGSKCVSHFKSQNWWVASIAFSANEEADANIVVSKNSGFKEQEETVLNSLKPTLVDNTFDAIICAAGGWAGGNAKNDLVKNTDLMWQKNVWASVIAGVIATRYLKAGGIMVLVGSSAALKSTPGMIGYGLSKAALHQLTKSLADKDSGLPPGSICVAILPGSLDTSNNRKWMPNADFAQWTPLQFIIELFWKWANNKELPVNGSLLQLVTNNSVTDIILA